MSQPQGTNWRLGALDDDTKAAKREIAAAGLNEMFDLENQYEEANADYREAEARKSKAYQAWKAKIVQLVESRTVELDRVYIVDDKAVMVTAKKSDRDGYSPGYHGHGKTPPEYEVKVMELG